jgi:hypothetical protein
MAIAWTSDHGRGPGFRSRAERRRRRALRTERMHRDRMSRPLEAIVNTYRARVAIANANMQSEIETRALPSWYVRLGLLIATLLRRR